MKKNTKKGMSNSGKIMVGGAVAALGAATAGAYYLLGPNAKVHQKKVADLMNKMKKEAMSEIKKAKKASAPVYDKVVDTLSKNYTKQYKAHEKDIKVIASKLKSEWKSLEKLATTANKKVAKIIKKK